MSHARHEIRFGDAAFDIADPETDRAALDGRYAAVLAAFVRDTVETCAFHRRRFDRAGVRPDELATMEDFRRIPLLGPGEVSAVPDTALLPDRYSEIGHGGLASLAPEERLRRKFLTTSSTGRPKGSYYTDADWRAATDFGPRLAGHIPAARRSRLFNLFHAGHVAGKLMEDIFGGLGAWVENNHHVNATPEMVVAQLGAGMAGAGGFNAVALPPFRPKELAGNKGMTLDALLDADVDNHLGAKIETVVLGGAPSPVEARLRERTWEANALAGRPPAAFLETYGSAEVGIVAADCEAAAGLHLLQGFVFTEVISEETGEPVKRGETGLVVFTGLKRGSRYLRYIVGDEATWTDEPCSCGRVSPRILNVRRVMEKERLTAGCAAGGY